MRPRVTLASAVLVFVSLAGSISALAHHNPKPMYESTSIMLTGTDDRVRSGPILTRVISVAVKTDSGAVQQWHAEFIPPAEMMRAGWAKETIRSGDQVTLTGLPGKHAQHIMWLQSLVTADGRKLSRQH